MSADYAEFNESRLAEIYDSFCPLGKDSDFFLNEVKKQQPQSILDVGCGSGILTVELAKIAEQVVGVEPATSMIELARKRSDGDKIKWIQGYAKDVIDIHVDAIMMTSHVAQFMLDDDEWYSNLKHFHTFLNAGGKLIFDSKNPLAKPWQSWNKENTKQVANTPHGKVEMWNELLAVKANRVQYQLHYLFDSGEKLISNNELIYRSKEELVASMQEAGFEIEHVYGDWTGATADETREDLVFVARKV